MLHVGPNLSVPTYPPDMAVDAEPFPNPHPYPPSQQGGWRKPRAAGCTQPSNL